MTKADQSEFIGDLARSIVSDKRVAIQAGKIPSDWDGHELRQLLADKFASSVYKMHPRRKRAYDNHMLVTNL